MPYSLANKHLHIFSLYFLSKRKYASQSQHHHDQLLNNIFLPQQFFTRSKKQNIIWVKVCRLSKTTQVLIFTDLIYK